MYYSDWEESPHNYKKLNGINIHNSLEKKLKEYFQNLMHWLHGFKYILNIENYYYIINKIIAGFPLKKVSI